MDHLEPFSRPTPPDRPKSTPVDAIVSHRGLGVRGRGRMARNYARGRLRRGGNGSAGEEEEEEEGESDDGEESDESDEEEDVSFHGFGEGTSTVSAGASRRDSGMQVDDDADDVSLVQNSNSTTTTTDRPTKPLPGSSKARKVVVEHLSNTTNMASTLTTTTTTTTTPSINATQSHPVLAHPKPTHIQGHPTPLPANPSLVPIQPRPPAANSQSRRLIVVLEQACLEAYRVSSGSGAQSSAANGKNRRGGVNGKGGSGGGEAKYALLNCDDHQGILAKMGRDIADARPDITHQVCGCIIIGPECSVLKPCYASVSSPCSIHP